MKSICLYLTLFGFFTAAQAQQINEKQKLSNISSFAQLYGYVRYFHPSDEASSINWNQFLNYGIKHVENASNADELKIKLNELFNPIAPTVIIGSSSDVKKVGKNY